ncbi:Lrp/AsnC family transcriptional regulator [Nissabacter archeti]|uniref:Lrp/AsnC family transcriptional regulator n=1 Tax=Nissabacter archeti TaxID=1917880 RepID=A0ABS5JEA0_9GAMM|nr:Lrp/AsnC family transcriptional regulator [Nissabacter archeti]MBS0967593.1 Lrp/AsnC family transcriptional regulator [Nissabacter archeti]
MTLTRQDTLLLKALQTDSRITNQALAEAAGMAPSPCWRRVKQLEEAGLITGYRAQLDRQKLGLGLLAFIRIKIDSHSEQEALRFEAQVQELPQVIACYATAGSADFLLQVVAQDLEQYSEFAMAVIRRLPGIKEMETSFVLKEIKPYTALPLGLGKNRPRLDEF